MGHSKAAAQHASCRKSGVMSGDAKEGGDKNAPADPPPGPDMVAKNKVWAEACEKEVRMIKLNTTFALGNLKNLDVFPEKPNLLKAETVPDEAEMEEAKELLNTLCSVKDTGALPNEKYDMPMTSSQEVGFRYKPFVPVNPMFHKPRGSCEITRYADAYYHTTGVTPFHRRTAQPKPE